MRTAKLILLSALSGLWMIPALAQDNSQDNTNHPNVRITVHKNTDKNGNIISYDSTYSYSYSGSGNGADTSIMNNMIRQFGGMNNNMFMGQPIDSIPGFMNNPLFQQLNFQNMDIGQMQKEMEQQMQQMQQMMKGGGWPMGQDFNIPAPAPVKPCPAPAHKKHPAKKAPPKQNNSQGDVQI